MSQLSEIEQKAEAVAIKLKPAVKKAVMYSRDGLGDYSGATLDKLIELDLHDRNFNVTPFGIEVRQAIRRLKLV